MVRTTEEWIGKDDDAKIPDRVRLRVFDRHNGICHRSGRKIRAGERWQCDHVVALVNGGQHRECNLAPILIAPHKEKTRDDVAEKKINARVRSKYLGIKKRKGLPMPGSRDSKFKRKIDGRWERR